MSPLAYLNATISELKQVHWPTRQTAIRLTLIVISISLLVGAYIGSLDYLFTTILTLLVK